MEILKLKNIKKTYTDDVGSFDLQINELEMKKGEIFGIIGPSGCGKTTLLKIVAGICSKSEGSIILSGKDITSVKSEKRGLGMVFQSPLLFPHMTVEQNVEFAIKIKKIPKKQRQKLISETLDAVGLLGYEKRYPSQLSGGQQQRISIARSIISKPKLLLMDEPFSSLDPSLRIEMRNLVKDINRKFGISILFVTHDREEAFGMFDRLAIMKNGRIITMGKPKEIYENPKEVFVANFLGMKNILKLRIYEEKTIIDKINLSLNKETAGYNYAVLKPESIKISKLKDNENGNYVTGIIEHIFFNQGFDNFVIRVESVTLEVVAKHDRLNDFSTGDNILLSIDENEIELVR